MDKLASPSLAVDNGAEAAGMPPRQDLRMPELAAEEWAHDAQQQALMQMRASQPAIDELDGVDTTTEAVEKIGRAGIFSRWLHAIRVRDLRRNRDRAIRTTIERNQQQVQAFMSMAQYAINLAVKSEPRRMMRNTKRQRLMDRWRGTYQRVFGGVGR